MVKEALEWDLFCDAIAREDLRHDPRFRDSAERRRHHVELVAILDEVFVSRTLAEWTATLDAHRVTFGLVQRCDALPDDAQAKANGLYPEIADGNGLRTIDSPIRIEGETKRAPHLAPAHGQHTAAVLATLGYSEADLAAMLAAGAIQGADTA